ncbi:MAG: cytochrome c oxidase subunit 3 [Gemmatimonadales bacterium]|nr:cytochrome c oxidase subunit 3 [Gemmatimonadales bacterium]
MNHATMIPAERPAFGDIPRGRIALWWVIASEVVIFGGLVAVYLLYRSRHPDWAEMAHHTSTPLGALNTFVLLTSSLSAVLAHEAVGRGDPRRAARLLLLTVLGGLVFLGVKSVEYATEIGNGYTPVSHLYWSFYYTMTGLHAAHVVAGMVAMLVVARGAARGEHTHRVELVGLYWHFVDVVWIFLFPLLYLAR